VICLRHLNESLSQSREPRISISGGRDQTDTTIRPRHRRGFRNAVTSLRSTASAGGIERRVVRVRRAKIDVASETGRFVRSASIILSDTFTSSLSIAEIRARVAVHDLHIESGHVPPQIHTIAAARATGIPIITAIFRGLFFVRFFPRVTGNLSCSGHPRPATSNPTTVQPSKSIDPCDAFNSRVSLRPIRAGRSTGFAGDVLLFPMLSASSRISSRAIFVPQNSLTLHRRTGRTAGRSDCADFNRRANSFGRRCWPSRWERTTASGSRQGEPIRKTRLAARSKNILGFVTEQNR